MPLIEGIYRSFLYKYIKVDRIRFMSSIVHPTQVFISFTIGLFPSNITQYQGGSYSTLSGGTNVDFTVNKSSFTGSMNARQGFGYLLPFSDSVLAGRAIYVGGTYNVPDVDDTSFILTPNSDLGGGFTYSDPTINQISISLKDINIIFVGSDSMLYDINQNLVDIKSRLLQVYTVINQIYSQDFDYYSWIRNTFYQFLQNWQSDWLQFHTEFTDLIPYITDIWDIYFSNTYTYGNANVGANMGFYNTSNPYTAINYNLRTINRILGYINRANWQYTSFSFDENGIGSSSSVSSVTWFDAILGYLSSQNSIEQHHVELENQVIEQGIDDVYDGYLGALPYGIGLIDYSQNLFSYSNFYEKDGIDGSADSGYNNWYSAYNKFSIDSVNLKDEIIVDFYTHNKIIFGGGLD